MPNTSPPPPELASLVAAPSPRAHRRRTGEQLANQRERIREKMLAQAEQAIDDVADWRDKIARWSELYELADDQLMATKILRYGAQMLQARGAAMATLVDKFRLESGEVTSRTEIASADEDLQVRVLDKLDKLAREDELGRRRRSSGA